MDFSAPEVRGAFYMQTGRAARRPPLECDVQRIGRVYVKLVE
jgi:hypothetical protein